MKGVIFFFSQGCRSTKKVENTDLGSRMNPSHEFYIRIKYCILQQNFGGILQRHFSRKNERSKKLKDRVYYWSRKAVLEIDIPPSDGVTMKSFQSPPYGQSTIEACSNAMQPCQGYAYISIVYYRSVNNCGFGLRYNPRLHANLKEESPLINYLCALS